MSEPLRVLVIDDEAGAPEEDGKGRSPALAKALQKAGHDAEALGPSYVGLADVQRRDLILVDFRITEEWTPQRTSLVQEPQEGLAVIAVIASWLEKHEEAPTGLALHSAKLEELGRGLAAPRAEHVVARLHGLEWSFSKVPLPDIAPTETRVGSLAAAVRRLAKTPRSDEDWKQLLFEGSQLDKGEPWVEEALRHLRTAQLPRDELVEASGGLVALRWLAHRVLPYPGTLIGASYVAAILGIELNALAGDTHSKLLATLECYRYRGVLADLVGPRWWRAGIEEWLASWEPTKIAVASQEGLDAMMAEVGERLEPALGMVACVDDEFEPAGELAPKIECVRLRPDDWPVFASPAWMRAGDVRAGDLEHYVDPVDLALLKT